MCTRTKVPGPGLLQADHLRATHRRRHARENTLKPGCTRESGGRHCRIIGSGAQRELAGEGVVGVQEGGGVGRGRGSGERVGEWGVREWAMEWGVREWPGGIWERASHLKCGRIPVGILGGGGDHVGLGAGPGVGTSVQIRDGIRARGRARESIQPGVRRRDSRLATAHGGERAEATAAGGAGHGRVSPAKWQR